jgi:hypothetical protein
LAQGVRGYDREALDDDYRLSALWLITRPVAQAMNVIAPRVAPRVLQSDRNGSGRDKFNQSGML